MHDLRHVCRFSLQAMCFLNSQCMMLHIHVAWQEFERINDMNTFVQFADCQKVIFVGLNNACRSWAVWTQKNFIVISNIYGIYSQKVTSYYWVHSFPSIFTSLMYCLNFPWNFMITSINLPFSFYLFLISNRHVFTVVFRHYPTHRIIRM